MNRLITPTFWILVEPQVGQRGMFLTSHANSFKGVNMNHNRYLWFAKGLLIGCIGTLIGFMIGRII